MILIVAVLSVVAMARFHDGFAQTRGFYDELLAQVQYARKAAVAQRRSVFVRIGATDSLLCYNAAGACNGVVGPNGAVPFRVAVPAGVTVTPVAFEFDGLGRYPAAGPLTVGVAGAGNLQFTVEHETGYVRP